MKMTVIPVKDLNYFKTNKIKYVNHCRLVDVEVNTLDDFASIISSNFYTPIKYHETKKEIKRNAKNFGNFIEIEQEYIIIDIDDIYSKEELNTLVNFLSQFKCYIVNTQSFGKEKHGKIVYPIRIFFPFANKRKGIMMINEFICDIIENVTGHKPDRISTELGRIFAPSYDIVFKVERFGSFVDDEAYKMYPSKEIKGYEGAWLNYLKQYVDNRKDINTLAKTSLNSPVKINIKGRLSAAASSENIYINFAEAKKRVKYLLKHYPNLFHGIGAGSLRGFSTNIKLPWNKEHTTSTYYLPDSDTIISFSQTVAQNFDEEYCKLGNGCIVFKSMVHFLAFTESIIGIKVDEEYIKMVRNIYDKFKKVPRVEEDAVIRFCLNHGIEFRSNKLGSIIRDKEFLVNHKPYDNFSLIDLNVSPLGSGKTYKALKNARKYDFTIFIANNQASVINIKNEAKKLYPNLPEEKIMDYLDIHSSKVTEGRYYYFKRNNPFIYITTMESFKNDKSLLKYRDDLLKSRAKIKIVFDEFDQVISNYDPLRLFYIIERFITSNKKRSPIKVEFLTATATDMFKILLEKQIGPVNIINNKNHNSTKRKVIFKHDVSNIIKEHINDHILFLCRSKKNVAKVNALLRELGVDDSNIGLITGLQSIEQKKNNLQKQFIISTAITSGYNFTRKPDLVIIYDDNTGLYILDWIQTLGRLTRKIFDGVPIYMIPSYKFDIVKNYQKLLEIDKEDVFQFDEYIRLLTSCFDSYSTVVNLMGWEVDDERRTYKDVYKNILDQYIQEIKENNIQPDNIVYKIFPVESEALKGKIEKVSDLTIKVDKAIEKTGKTESIKILKDILNINKEEIDYSKQKNRILYRFFNILREFFNQALYRDDEFIKDLIERNSLFDYIDGLMKEYRETTYRKMGSYGEFEDFMKNSIIYKRDFTTEMEDKNIEDLFDADNKYEIELDELFSDGLLANYKI